MANVFVIIDTVTGKFIERDKVVYWNLDTLENARTWSTRRAAEIQIAQMVRVMNTHNTNRPTGSPPHSANFEVRPATLTIG